MTTLGLDFYNKRNSPTVFKQAIEAAQNSAMQAKWILCDAYFFAEDSPQYDDIFHQYFNERKGSLNSIKKYRSTIRKFPYARRKHELSIEAYYTVVSLDEPDQDRLLSQFASGELETRQALRDADANEKVRCIILTGSDKAFAAGADIKEMKDQYRSGGYFQQASENNNFQSSAGKTKGEAFPGSAPITQTV